MLSLVAGLKEGLTPTTLSLEWTARKKSLSTSGDAGDLRCLMRLLVSSSPVALQGSCLSLLSKSIKETIE